MFKIDNKKVEEVSRLLKNINFNLDLFPGIEIAKDINDAKKNSLYIFM